jgi:hypothetical protein
MGGCVDKKRISEEAAGGAAILLGFSDFGIELIDSWARWDMLSHIPHLGWVGNRFVAPVLIFVGMLLILRAQQKEHNEELKAAQNLPAILVTDWDRDRKRKSWIWWKIPAIWLPLSGIVAGIASVAILWCYSPEIPPVLPPPPVTPLAYTDWSTPRGTNPRPIINQQTNGPCSPNVIGGIVDNKNCGVPDPYKPVKTYEPDGSILVSTPTSKGWDFHLQPTAERLDALQKSSDWKGIVVLAEETQKTDPGWFTLDFLLGLGQVNDCQTSAGEKYLRQFLSETANAPDYIEARGKAENLLRDIGTFGYQRYCIKRLAQ